MTTSSDGPLSADLWRGITGIYDAILAHPFLTGLTDGTLAEAAFTHYVIQDALFLRDYARALAAVASRAPDNAGTELFAGHAVGVIADEQQLHEFLLADLGLDPDAVDRAEPAPTTLAYTSYLLAATAGGSWAEGIATVLPCYWIYWEVGQELARSGSPEPRYQRWIETYSSPDFGAVVRAVLAITDRLGPDLGGQERARVHTHFRATSRYEWMFWDMGYRQQAWPV